MTFFLPQNPGIGGLDELTLSEEEAIQTIASLGSPLQVLRTNAGGTGIEWAAAGGGSGDVSKVGTPANNQVAIWTGDGTVEGDSDLTYDGTILSNTGAITSLDVITADSFSILEGSAPTATAGYGKVYVKSSDSKLYFMNDSSTEYDLTAASSSGRMTWTEVTGTSQSASVNNGYIANNAALVTITLPDTAAVGDIVRVVGKGAGLWKIAQNASETINFGNQTTTSGTGGYIESYHRYDCIELVCITANTTWTVMSYVGGNFNVV